MTVHRRVVCVGQVVVAKPWCARLLPSWHRLLVERLDKGHIDTLENVPIVLHRELKKYSEVASLYRGCPLF